ncbi:hypothetical protein B9G55_02350 [Saccharibacillus sp. O16]|nr:hypothetical protein B9G55_02350 [Saccharibacillus sp. O16]
MGICIGQWGEKDRRWGFEKIPIYVSCLVAMLSVSACSVTNNLESPPSLNIKIEGDSEKSAPAKLATYNWNGKMTYGGPWEAAQDETTITAKPNSVVNLVFEKEAQELNVRQHISSSEFVEIESDANAFTVPAQPGEYVYGIKGDWTEGTAIYGIKIKVE